MTNHDEEIARLRQDVRPMFEQWVLLRHGAKPAGDGDMWVPVGLSMDTIDIEDVTYDLVDLIASLYHLADELDADDDDDADPTAGRSLGRQVRDSAAMHYYCERIGDANTRWVPAEG